MDVRIYQPQQVRHAVRSREDHDWILEYELKSPRTPEGLMGWASSKDTLNQVRV